MRMDLFSVLVTGANRGIGLEFVRQLSCLQKPPRFVFATYRSETSLEKLKEIRDASKESQVILIKADITKQEDVIAARKIVEEKVGEKGLTLLINNAGVAIQKTFPQMTGEDLLTCFTTNAVGPTRVLQEMLPLLQKAAARDDTTSSMSASRAAVLNISSMVGSITRAGVELKHDLILAPYKISKAALNMSMKIGAAEVKDKGILVVLMCPGWVKTDMGTEQGALTPEESISAMLQTLEKLDDSHHGSYMDRLGNSYPF